MNLMTVADLGEEDFVQIALETYIEGHSTVNIPMGIVAQWVAQNWPLSYDTDPRTASLLEQLEWHLGSTGSSVPDWLSEYDGLPTVVAAVSRGLEIVRTENMVSHLIDKHSAVVHQSIGVGPEVREAFQITLETRLSEHHFGKMASAACTVFSGFDVAMSTEAQESGDHYDLMASLRLNRAYLSRLVRHSMQTHMTH